jgi:Hypoxia induced protein conserved region.
MESVLTALMIVAALAVLLSLGLGLVGMVKTHPNQTRQNRFMQLRILFQLLALILLGLMFYFR